MDKKKKKPNKAEKEFVKNTIELNPTLNEAEGKTVVVAWGRMNPVTIGHEKLVNKVKQIARQRRADPKIFLSHSHDPKKNPLSYEDKIEVAQNAFGSIVYKSTAKTIMEVMKQLQGQYKNVVLVAGADRIKEFDTLLQKYNGKDYKFDSIEVVSAGARDPDANDVTGMSASKMRALALAGDKETFKKGLPTKLKRLGDEVYAMVRKGMRLAEGLEPEQELEEAVLSLQQRLQRGRVMRRIQPRLKVRRARAAKRMAPKQNLEKRARKKAIQLIRKKVAGEKGLHYSQLSSAQKMQIDKLVDKRKNAIGRIAKRLLPKVRKDEMIRFRQAVSGPQTQKKINEAFEAQFKVKKPHQLYNKDNTVKHDRRFKRYHSIKEDHDLLNIIEEVFESIELNEAKIQKTLEEKANKSLLKLDTIQSVYKSAYNKWDESYELTAEQLGFNAVNSYIANNRRFFTLDEEFEMQYLDEESILDKAVAAIHKHVRAGADLHDTAWKLTRTYNVKFNSRALVNKYIEKHGDPHKKSSDPTKASALRKKYGFSEQLEEGVNDPSIFKAVFLAGGPGSGKSFIVGKTALTALGFKVVNSDAAFEIGLRNAGMEMSPENIYSPKGQEIRGKAKTLTKSMMQNYINGRLGLVIDGTGKDYSKIEKQAKMLRELGYEVAMIFVNTDLDTALERNRMRDRSLPDVQVETMWKEVQKNIGKFQHFFRQKMFIVDNSAGSNYEAAVMSTYKKISAWSKKAPASSAAKKWVDMARGVKEEHGAGEWGTDKLTKKYKKDTPKQKVNEAFEALMGQDTCDLVSMKQMRAFEKFVDRMFEKYNIDFEFTKHFGDRMGDDRNKPCIKMKELADFITKIYKNQGKNLKAEAGAEAVIKDMQTDLNIPIVVKYDQKEDEFDVVAKTIMRKKKFSTPNKVIKY